jgi:hypothetical protein
MSHARHLAVATAALIAGLSLAHANAQLASKPAQMAQERQDGAPQTQEEQAGNSAQLPQRKPDEQAVAGQPQGKRDVPAVRGQPQVKPDNKAARQKQAPRPRRAVAATIGRMPQPSAPPAYGPVLHDVAPQTTMPAPAPAGLPPPAVINNCVGGQCTDTSGNSYQTGTGNAALDSKGRLCTRNGQTMQCF